MAKGSRGGRLVLMRRRGVASWSLQGRQTSGHGDVEDRDCGESKEPVVCRGKEHGQVVPSSGLVDFRVGGGGVDWAESQKATSLLDLVGKGIAIGNQVLLRVADSLEKLWGRLASDKLDVLLEAEHEFELTLNSMLV